MSVEKVITGYPDYSNVSFLEDLRTTYGGDIVEPFEGRSVPVQIPAPRIEAVIPPTAEQTHATVPAHVGPLAVSGAH